MCSLAQTLADCISKFREAMEKWLGRPQQNLRTHLLLVANPALGRAEKFHVVWLLNSVWLFCSPMNYSPSGSSVYGISQARILEWVDISFSRGSFWPKDWTCISCIGRQIIYHWTTWEVGQLHMLSLLVNNSGWTSTVDWVGTDACGFIWENKGFEETENVHDVLWAL